MKRYRRKAEFADAIQWDETMATKREIEAAGATASQFNGNLHTPEVCTNLHVTCGLISVPVNKGDWIVKDSLGFFCVRDKSFLESFDEEPTETRISLTESQFRDLIESVYKEGFIHGWDDYSQHERAASKADDRFYGSRSMDTMNGIIRVEVLPNWRPIETAPKDGTYVALWGGFLGIDYYDIGRWDRGEWDQSYGCGEMRYWRPLREGEWTLSTLGCPIWADIELRVR